MHLHRLDLATKDKWKIFILRPLDMKWAQALTGSTLAEWMETLMEREIILKLSIINALWKTE